MKLFPHQVEALEWIKGKDKVILALDMGLGKTAIASQTIEEGERVLIICPASLKLNWLKELKVWSNAKKFKVIKKKTEELPKGPGVVIVNYDLLGKKVKKRAQPNYDFKDFDRVIVDEAHALKNPTSVRSKIGGKIIKLTPKAILLSGTPMERPVDLYVPLFSMGAIEDSYPSFGMKYCDAKRVYLGAREVWQYRGATNTEELKERIKPYMLRMLKEDVIDLPKKIIKVVGLDLPLSRQEKSYSLSAIIKDPRPIGFEGLAELLHEQAIKKLPLAIKHIKMRLEQEEKIFIVARHTDVIDTLAEKLKEYGVLVFDGRCSAEEKDSIEYAFQNESKYRLFLGQITACSTGLTLTAANHVILVEPDWSYSKIAQVIDRTHRIGQKETVTAELLTIADSIDERVLFTTLEKKGYINDLIGL